MKEAPEVLTRMKLSCCWGDNLNKKELNDVVDYINDLEQQCRKQKEVIDKTIEYIKENIYSYYDSNGEKCIEETVFERNANPKELLGILKEVSE